MMARKHYTRQTAEGLLTKAVDLLASRPAPTVVQMRRVYLALLQARMPDVNVPPETVAALRDASDDTIREWHKTVHDAVAWVQFLRRHTVKQQRPVMDMQGVTVRLNGRDSTLEIVAAPFQALILRIVSLLWLVGPERVVKCDCGKIFLRIGKRRTCSVRCQKRVYMRKYRNPEEGED
jgi:hypothetical protein